jgi:hypothetical protein
MTGRSPWRPWSRTEATSGRSEAPLSRSAILCLDRQLGEALDLAVTCRALSDWSLTDGDPLTAVALERLSTELSDQAANLTPLVPTKPDPASPPMPSPPGLAACLAELAHRLSRAALVAQTDAMTPGLETAVAATLWALAVLYGTRRELLLVCTQLDSA